MTSNPVTGPRPDNASADTAPGPLRWIEEFINTRRADGDLIAAPQQLSQWLHDRGLTPARTDVTDAQRARAASVREGLRALIAANNAETVASPRPDGLDPAAQASLAALTAQIPLTLDVSRQPPRLAPATSDPIDAAMATLLIAVANAVADGTWPRLKACREPSCRWAYYDHSRNRRRTWCSMELCGNRAKARAAYNRKSNPHAEH
ncbi:CGNR zinc finger domain-containing protein [Streptomyces sp. NPDC015345]|uniref:CGNR zinc finger domain-containing protein n=1 Tax=Streptomyces sp. NPDC015345 TaxID=3364953 RepID=UPI0036F6F5A8